MAVIVYSNYFITDNDAVLFRLGILCNFFTVLFFASPLSTLVSMTWLYLLSSKYSKFSLTVYLLFFQAEVFKTKSTESMSFPLSLLSLFVTSLWVTYSYLVDDLYIKVSAPCCTSSYLCFVLDSKSTGIAVGTSSINALCNLLEQETKIDYTRIACFTMNTNCNVLCV